MYAVGDKVFYKGRVNRFNRIEPQIVRKYVNGFVYIEGQVGRFNASSFYKLNVVNPIDNPLNLMDELTKRANDNGRGLCHYALEFEGGRIRYQIADACHARMPYCTQYGDKVGEQILKAVALNVSAHWKQIVNKNAYKSYVKYITQESRWKDMFIAKPVEEILNSGVYINVTKEYWQCVSAAIALRVGHEHASRLPLFQEILDLGFSGDVAFVVSQFAYDTAGKYSFVMNQGGHHVINNGLCTIEKLAAFIKGGVDVDSGMSYKEAKGRSYEIQGLISKPLKDGITVFDSVLNTCKHIVHEIPNAWGDPQKSIDLSDTRKLVYVCNYFAKAFK